MKKALPGIHALSGCDSTSSPSGIGKIKFFKAVVSEQWFVDAVYSLGKVLDLSVDLSKTIEELFCNLYGAKDEDSINKVRYKKFTLSRKVPDPQNLPPTQDALL